MRARTTAAAGLAVLIALAGCTAAEPVATGTATATSTPTPTASPSELDCDDLLPVGRASAALGVPSRALEGTRDVAVRGSAELIREAAQENGGLLTCSWYEEDGVASITASAAEDAAEAFAAAAHAGTRLAVDTEAFSSCSADLCDVDLLAGSTWITIELTNPPADADLTTLASETAAASVGAALDEPITAPAPVCDSLLSTEQLTTTAGLVQATPGSGTEGAAPATASAAAAARAGYASCTWTDPTSSAYSGLSVDVLPNGEEGWRNLSLTSGLAIPLAPLDGLGDRALSGCGGGSCEIDVLADSVWWRVQVTGDAARADAVARALIAG
ncbi:MULTISPECIES: hypothetical protein [unclassified Rathayibacter]|uniref:hypothetical protein n=1 Tax=unclassified Rathayibacter TaxID=2609250 RepID=UPI0006F2F881|nr:MULTISPECIES: hypothetical protein [unclassified Rathayibacter]KQQ06210.1 hypothetical protein ASF42_06770 [Rathayibacter sp. Leaf294]KQS14066.1 hypothetical protein ASG06_06775 [Rathayibacter sp. Leaf185]